MNKNIIIALFITFTLVTSCTKQQNDPIECNMVEIPTYGYGTMLTFGLTPTDSYRYPMMFSNDHDYAIEFKVEFPDLPNTIQATIERSSFSLTDTRDYYNYVTLTTKNAKPGTYNVPVVVTTDKGKPMSATLEIRISDEVVQEEHNAAPMVSYYWK